MVTKNEQMAPIVQPKAAILIAVIFLAIGVIVFFVSSSPKPASTAVYTQDAGNQPGSSGNSMNSGSSAPSVTGSPGSNSVLPVAK